MRALRLVLFGVIGVMGLGRAAELILFAGSLGQAIVPGAMGLLCFAIFLKEWKKK